MIYPNGKRALRLRRITLISIRSIPERPSIEYTFHCFDEDRKKLQDFSVIVKNGTESEMRFLIESNRISLPYEVIQEAMRLTQENERAARRIRFQAEYESDERKR